jgi:hypothetical protein
MPRPQKLRLMLLYNTLHRSEFLCAESEVPGERDRLQQELGRLVISVDMDMRRFPHVMTHKVYPVGTDASNCRHLFNALSKKPRAVPGLFDLS